jgi:hypothetical protein
MKKLLFALLLAACTTGNNEAKNTANPIEVSAQKPMPSFSLTKLGGGTFASSELAGKPLMVNFWHPS